MELVIMAAGMGSRFGGLKQIEPINDNGEFIIDYSIYDAIRCGFDKVIFIIKEENYNLFRDTIGKRIESKIKVEYVFQDINNLPKGYSVPEGRVKPWGTGHAILSCKDIVTQNFGIINADDFYGFDAIQTLAEFLKNNNNPNSYALVGYKIENTLSENGSAKRGVCEINGGQLTNIIESVVELKDNKIIATPLDSDKSFEVQFGAEVSMNMFGFTPHLFNYLESRFVSFLAENKNNLEKCEYLIPTVVAEQIKKRMVNVEVLNTKSVWYGITYKEDKEKVVQALKDLTNNGVYPKNLWN